MKGVSPVISSVIVIAVTVAVGIVFMTWAPGLVSESQDKVSNKTSESVECSSASITLESVYVTAGSSGVITAAVRNSGYLDITVESAQAFNKTGSNFSALNMPLSLTKGSLATLIFNRTSMATCPGDFSQVIVTTRCGGVSDKFDSTPKCN